MMIEETPYAEWLEESVKAILDFAPDSMALVAMRDSDGMALTAYYQASVEDKGKVITNILSDFIMELLENNAPTLRNIVMDAENDEDEEENDEDG